MKIIVLLVLALPSTAYAYVDGASSSVIFQTIVGLIAGGWIFAKLYWRRLASFFSRKAPAEVTSTSENSQTGS